MTLRTSDREYGPDYWNSLDGGLGYQDSVMWEDIAHVVKELFCIHRGNPARDASGEYHLMDVGCAMGYLVKHLRRRGVDAYGLDFSDYALAHADDFARPYLFDFDLTLDVPPPMAGRFNVVTCFETMEHIPPGSAERASKHLWDLLEPGGRALLTICVEGQPGWDTDPTHLNVVSRDYWEGLFDRQGWRPLRNKVRYLRGFWLFSQHKGVFVLRKPFDA